MLWAFCASPKLWKPEVILFFSFILALSSGTSVKFSTQGRGLIALINLMKSVTVAQGQQEARHCPDGGRRTLWPPQCRSTQNLVTAIKHKPYTYAVPSKGHFTGCCIARRNVAATFRFMNVLFCILNTAVMHAWSFMAILDSVHLKCFCVNV